MSPREWWALAESRGVPETPRGRALASASLVALTALVAIITTCVSTAVLPPLALVLPLVIGGLICDIKGFRAVLVAVTLAIISELGALGFGVVHPGAFVVLVIIALISFRLVSDRERNGLSLGRGDSMLLDLASQLRAQGDLPTLPPGWTADFELRPAGAARFGGDFLVSTFHGDLLELALVDVSGKGIDAGSRALLLSGALGGLLGAVPEADFLPAANAYVLAQRWDEGFATAVHLCLNLRTGAYVVRSAGHPPVVHHFGGSGRWDFHDDDHGPALGLLDGVDWPAVSGALAPHDSLVACTDGVIEVPGRDLEVGIDRLVGALEREVARGFAGGASALVTMTEPADAADDRALLLIRRT